MRRFGLLAGTVVLLLPASAHAAAAGQDFNVLLWLAVLLLAGKLGTLVERVGLPAVLGEIVAGVALGNLTLLGIDFLAPALTDPIIGFLAQLGAVLLLFQLGLETDIRAMRRVGMRATAVALIGVIAPFVLGVYVVGPALLPGMPFGAYLFIGAALTATSIGITGRVFRDMGCLGRPESQVVLGAAVIDDVLGLLILSVVSAIATRGTISAGEVASISGLAIGFLGAAVVGGQVLADYFSRFFSKLHRGHGMKLAAALLFCFAFAYGASLIGLAPIVGAFAAGLVLTDAHFRHFDHPAIKTDVLRAVDGVETRVLERVRHVLDRHADKHVERMVEPIAQFLVPLFFVLAGMNVKLELFADPHLIAVALGLTAAAVFGKLVAGVAAGRGLNKWLVGWGMVPRGEVGLIFAFVGKSLGVVNDEAFSVIVMMVMLTTMITPPVLSFMLRTRRAPAEVAGDAAAGRIG